MATVSVRYIVDDVDEALAFDRVGRPLGQLFEQKLPEASLQR